MKFQMKDIEVGDGEYFERHRQTNPEVFWTVIEKINDNLLRIEVNKMAANDNTIIELKDITHIEKRKKR